jgi:hypothetical protein
LSGQQTTKDPTITMSNTNITFKKSNYTNGGVEYTARLENRERANEVAAQFPKSCRVWAADLMGCEDDKGIVIFRVLPASSNKGMGEMNETGAARLKSFLKHAAKIGAVA